MNVNSTLSESYDDLQASLLTLEPASARAKAGFLSRMFLWWIVPALKLAQKESLEMKSLDELTQNERSLPMHEKFKHIFYGLPRSKFALVRALLQTFFSDILLLFFWCTLSIVAQITAPIMIKLLIECIDQGVNDKQKAILAISAILLSRFINMISSCQARYLIKCLGFDGQSVLSVELLCKSLRTSFLSNVNHTSGEVINLMQVDAGRLQFVTFYLNVAFLVPFQLGVTIYLMFHYIGVSFLGGFGVMIISAIFNSFIGKYVQDYQKKTMEEKDKRTKFANQLFSQIKFIKINAFEEYFKSRLFTLRKVEANMIRKRFLGSAYIIFSVWVTPLLILCATFALYILQDETLTAANTFAIIGLFQMLQQPLLQLPMAINELISTHISMQRVQKYFYTAELMLGCLEQDYYTDEYAIQIENGNFYWPNNKSSEENKEAPKANKKKAKKAQVKSEVTPAEVAPTEALDDTIHVLKELNLKIPTGQFVAIIGDVGSGKSSLLQALVGEMLYKLEAQPKIKVKGQLAYVSQKAWIQNATVKDNIIFGYRFSESRYRAAIKYSCLNKDLAVLIKGDQTMIGEKGVNLSGGQKARISLARAIYSDADVLLLDDPISAVDAYVGNYIMTKTLNNYLQTKTRILVTHALNNCQHVDYIYLMEDGKISEQGRFEDIKQSSSFKRIYEKFYKDHPEDNQSEEGQKPTELDEALQLIKKDTSEHQPLPQPDNADEDTQMIEEDREKGNISFQVYKEYFATNGGAPFYVSLIMVQVFWMLCYLGNALTISLWTESADDEELDNLHYLRIFFYFSLGQGLFAFLRPLMLVIKSVESSNKIHTKMINCLIYAQQCAFFERVPLGRLLNRFTKDINSLDTEIYWGVSWLCVVISLLIANLTIYIWSSTAYIIIPIALYLLACWYIKEIFLKASRELQRLESICKSPILSYFSESINGLVVIRIFKKELQITEQHVKNIDENRRVFYALQGANAWFTLVLGVLSLIVNLLAIVYCVFYSSKDAALAGLLLTYASNLDSNVTECVQAFGLLELGLVSFERCFAYTQVDPEPAYKELVDKSQRNEPHEEKYIENWPREGKITYMNYSMQYREGLKPALSNLSFVVEAKDKVGIVGRTGAGKSSITLSLLRILEAMQGSILIDDVDIQSLSLKQLRENITMIMQDATIFDGSIRENTDPLGKRTDAEIVEVLKACCLEEFLQKRNGLDGMISEGGENMSAGEKQLLCIARAVLKKSKIVLIDEATANIDVETEHRIQDTIIKVFKDCTVLTIAHRINTILHSDKILVIDEGSVVEYGRVQELLEKQDSRFYGIYQEALKHQKK